MKRLIMVLVTVAALWPGVVGAFRGDYPPEPPLPPSACVRCDYPPPAPPPAPYTPPACDPFYGRHC